MPELTEAERNTDAGIVEDPGTLDASAALAPSAVDALRAAGKLPENNTAGPLQAHQVAAAENGEGAEDEAEGMTFNPDDADAAAAAEAKRLADEQKALLLTPTDEQLKDAILDLVARNENLTDDGKPRMDDLNDALKLKGLGPVKAADRDRVMEATGQ